MGTRPVLCTMDWRPSVKSDPALALFRVARPYVWALPILVVLGIAASLAEGLGIGLLIPALDAILESEQGGGEGIFGSFMQGLGERIPSDYALPVLGLAIVALVALKTGILVLEAVVSTRIASSITRDLRVSLARQFLDVGMAYHARVDQGRLVNILDNQTWRASEALRSLSHLIGCICTVFVFTILLFLLSWQMALIALATAIPVTLLIRFLSLRARRHGERLVTTYSTMVGRVMETLTAMRTIRLFGQESAEAERFNQSADEVKRSHIRSDTLVAILPPVAELMYLPVFMAVLIYALQAGTGIPTVLAFLLVLYRLQSPLKMANTARVNISNLAEGVAEIERILDRSDKPYLTSGSRRLESGWEEIELEDVGFRYEDDSDLVLKGVSFRIPRGTHTAIVGGSGAGKSTITNLLCRFFDPTSGRITVDGVPLPDLELADWRRRIAFAGQDAELLSGSIAWNIGYGIPDAGMDDIRRAAELACAADFIEELPRGYDTLMGPRGLTFSGGQRQRIALARALLRRPELLILDEATNAVDPPTERTILGSILREFSNDTTIVLVTHRPIGLRQMDQIVVFEEGRVTQVGAPAELGSVPGALSRLFREPGGPRAGLAANVLDGPPLP
jgi:ATP-binding cassette, subfamily B, bacterial MsbA